MNVSIPNDVAFVGYDRLEMHDIMNLNLTLVERDAELLGRRAMELMLTNLSNPQSTSNKIILMPELCVRGSEQLPKRFKEEIE